MPEQLTTIQQLRTARDWNHHQLAHRFGVTSGTVLSWERGKQRPHKRYVDRMAALFGVPAEAILLVPDPAPLSRIRRSA